MSQGNFGQFIRAVNMDIYVTKAIEVKIYDTFDSSWTIKTVVRVVQFSGNIRKHSVLSPKFHSRIQLSDLVNRIYSQTTCTTIETFVFIHKFILAMFRFLYKLIYELLTYR